MIQGTASEAALVVLLAARDKVLRTVGKDAIGKLVAYASDQTHSSLQKACQVKMQIHQFLYGLSFATTIFLYTNSKKLSFCLWFSFRGSLVELT